MNILLFFFSYFYLKHIILVVGVEGIRFMPKLSGQLLVMLRLDLHGFISLDQRKTPQVGTYTCRKFKN